MPPLQYTAYGCMSIYLIYYWRSVIFHTDLSKYCRYAIPGLEMQVHLVSPCRWMVIEKRHSSYLRNKPCRIHQIVIRTLSGFSYLCQQLAYLVFSRIYLIASKIGESLGSYQEYPAKSVGKQEEELLMVALEKS
jgi:hypothetical protein